MKSLRPGVLLLAAFALIMESCAGGAASMPVEPIRLGVASVAELQSAYGYSSSLNPYLAPSTMLRGRPEEFIVLRVDTNLPRKSLALLTASVLGPDGAFIAESAGIGEMRRFWDLWPASDSDASRRMTSLERSYLGRELTPLGPGKKSYYAVIKTPGAFPRPGTVVATLRVEGLGVYDLETELPTPTK